MYKLSGCEPYCAVAVNLKQKEVMRKFTELNEEISEVNYFLKEWIHLKQCSSSDRKALADPEMRFITRTIERLINEAEKLSLPLVLTVIPEDVPRNDTLDNSTAIPLTECLRITNKTGDRTSYVGNKNGLLSLYRVATLVAHGGSLSLMGLPDDGWGS